MILRKYIGGIVIRRPYIFLLKSALYKGTSVEVIYPAGSIGVDGLIPQADFTSFVFTNTPSNPDAIRV